MQHDYISDYYQQANNYFHVMADENKSIPFCKYIKILWWIETDL